MQNNVRVELSTRFQFPAKLRIVQHRGRFLAVCAENARWIVLDNQSQVDFLHLLEQHTLGDALDIFQGGYDDAKAVVTQVVARKLDAMPQMRASVNGLSTLHLYLTNQCNMRCPHCYMSAGVKEQNELTTEEVKYVLYNFKQRNGSLATLSGGEVSTRKYLLEICKYADSIGLPIEVLTNGISWTADLVSTVAPILTRVQISIDGFNEEVNRIVRGPNAFEKSLRTVDMFVKAGVQTEIAVTPVFSEELHKHIDDYCHFVKSLEEKYAGSKFKVQLNGDIMDGRDMRFTDQQRTYYSDFIHSLLFKLYGEDTAGSFIATMKNGIIKDNCAYGNLSVASNGDVYFCAFIPTLKPIANIRTTSFDSIIELSKEAKALSIVDNLKPCSECELKYICGGDCRINHFPHIHDPKADKLVQCARVCTHKHKEMFYDLMLDTNTRLFS